jgi:hypothetical protein
MFLALPKKPYLCRSIMSVDDPDEESKEKNYF